MCGIAGVLDLDGSVESTVLDAMTDALAHRGPDDRGVVVEGEGRVGLGSRRLAVVDLSVEGHQPMVSACGRYVITYNGEVYNAAPLRRELEGGGARFRGRSDTEVLLAAVTRWGLFDALERIDGMFAFALWDRQRRELHLVRDRFGEKPLYLAWHGRRLLFGSELGALRAHPGFSPDIDRGALALLFRHTYIPAPHSIYTGVRKLPAGAVLTVGPDGRSETVVWWSAVDAADRAGLDPLDGAGEESTDHLEAVLQRAVRTRTVADVPVGLLLSGGVDSSTILALLTGSDAGPVRTFTIGFEEQSFDEAPFARAVARRLGADHTELYVTPGEAMAVIPRLPSVYGEPFADQSAIPTVLLAELARRHVTVALTGDGGDELFGGYHHHVRPFSTVGGLSRLRPARRRRAARQLHLDSLASWPDPSVVVRGVTVPPTAFSEHVDRSGDGGDTSWRMHLDTATFLPDDILVKMDRAAMTAGLENRSPFLDHRVFEAAWRWPVQERVRGSVGKRPLRRVLERHLPTAMIDRPKMGFNAPLGSWLRGPLRPWADELLSERSAHLDLAPVRAAWRAHQERERDAAYQLWPALTFLQWFDAEA